MEKKYLVGIDEGTTGTKTCVFDLEGNLISSSYCEYPSFYPKPGYVEQDVKMIEDAIYKTCKEATSRVNADDILAVSFSAQGAACILLDEYENVVRNRMIGWQDLRNIEVTDVLKSRISDEEHYEIEGSCIGGFNTGVNVWLQINEPETWKKVRRVCTNHDYFLRKLGADNFYIDIASAHRISVLDVNKSEWSPRLRKVYGFDNVELPIIVKNPGQVVGTVSSEISEKTGLPVGCKVCVGAQDVNCSSFGAGGINEDVSVMVVGTFGANYVQIDKPIRDPNKLLIVKGNQGVGNWQLEAFSHTAASALRWFRDKLCSFEVGLSNLIGNDPYDLITKLASKSVPGSNGVIALTSLQGSHGRRINDNFRGTFIGINLSTEKSDIAHAVLEGICFEMYDILKTQEQFSNKIKTIRLSGGVTKSDYWCQMFADIMGKNVELITSPEVGALGAAMYAGIGIGKYKNCIEAVDKCVRIKKVFKPNNEMHSLYEKAYIKWDMCFEISCFNLYK